LPKSYLQVSHGANPVTRYLLQAGGVFSIIPARSGDLDLPRSLPVVVPFAICYPTMLALFSESAGEDEQGWVMGITIALFTLGCGMISLAGGAMMAISPRLPFMAGIASFSVALIFIATLWPQADVKALDKVEQYDAGEATSPFS
jgi:hypothetical protein